MINDVINRYLTESNKTIIKLKTPKGFKVNVRQVEKGWYDYTITHNGMPVMGSSGTMFELKEQCKKHGIESAMIMAGELPDRMDFKGWRDIEVIS